MNAQRYRLIFNRHRGQLMAVAENVVACGKDVRSSSAGARSWPESAFFLARLRLASYAVLLAFGADLFMPRIAAAQAVAYKAAPASQRPTVLTAANGVPLVNIQTPSAAGVSHNAYSQFDVQAQGLILNNARNNVATQLGGWVQGNPWLARGSARVILNEVIAANPSQLLGYVEVAGSPAQVVIANPAGVTCNGCGFINASRATLTTGTPLVNGGSLEGYRVEGGSIRIEGAGMDASRAAYTDIIARAVEVNAGLWAQTLKVTAGTNMVDAGNTQAAPIAPAAASGPAPAFAIDVAQLGGMYAGKIVMVGTEAGVGVRNAGHIGASVGEVIVSADGKLSHSGSLSAASNVGVTASSVENGGTLYARGTLEINTPGDITNTGGSGAVIAAGADATLSARRIEGDRQALFAAGLSEGGSLAGTGKLTLTAGEQITTRGQQAAGGDLAISARELDLSSTRNSARSIVFAAQGGDLDLSGATTLTAGTMTAHAAQKLAHAGAQSHAGQLDLAAHTLDNRRGELVQIGSGDTRLALAGDLDNRAGRIAVNSHKLELAARTLDNAAGRIEHAGAGTLTLTAETLAGTGGRISSNGTLALSAQTVTLDTAETVAARLDIAAQSLSQRGGRLLWTGQEGSTIAVAGGLDNRGGTLSGNGRLDLVADTLDNLNGGRIETGGDLALTAASLANAAGRIESGGALTARISGNVSNADGSVIAGKALTLSAASLDNTAGTLGVVAGALTVTTGGALDNTSGRIEAGQDIALVSSGLSNREGTVLGRNVSLDTRRQTLDNTRGTLAASGTLSVDSGTLNNDGGRIRVSGDLTIDTHGTALANTNAGSAGGILGEAKVTLAVGQLDNTAGFTGAKGALDVRGDTVVNTAGGRLVSESSVALSARALDNRSGRIESVGDLTLAASERVDNRGALLRSGTKLSLETAHLNNADTLATDQGIEGKALVVRATDLDNRSGALRADTTLNIDSHGGLDNRRGLVSSAQALAVRDGTASRTLAVLNDDGTLIAGEQLDLVAASLAGGRVLSQRDLAISLAGALENRSEITANRNATLNTAGALINSGTLQAGHTLAVTTASLDNRAGGQIIAPELRVAATDSHTLTNRGLIDGGDVRIDAITINNLGDGRIYGDQLGISASTLNNHAESGNSPVIAARGRLDLGASTLSNRDGALIFSAGDLAIGGTLDANNRANGRAGSISNASATIEALGNLGIAAGRIDNTNEHFSARTEVVGTQAIAEYQGSGSATRYTRDQVSLVPHEKFTRLVIGGGYYNNWYLYDYTRTTTETRIEHSAPGQILAGGAMSLAADALRNDNSRVLAAGALTATLGSLSNTETAGERTIADHGTTYYYWKRKADGKDKQGLTVTAYAPAPTIESIALAVGGYGGNTAVSGSGTTLSSQKTPGAVTRAADAVGHTSGVNPGAPLNRIVRIAIPSVAGGPGMIVSLNAPALLPTSDLYRSASTPSSRYLIETDPRFANYRLWLSSDYMLSALALDPARTQKRLGDGFYEQRLIAEQVGQLTGRRFLAGYANDEAQYKALMDAGVTYAKEWQLVPGIALSAEQMARLTTDIVWFVEKTVTLADGSTQKVLAPQVYARVQPGDLAQGGSLIAGSRVDLKLTGDLENSGTIAGRELVALSAENVRNLGRVTGREISVEASRNLSVLGGTLDAERTLIARAGGDLTVESLTRTQTNAQGSRTNIARVAGLYVTGEGGTLLASAGRDLMVNAARIDSGGSAMLSAGQDLSLGTVQEASKHTIVLDAKNRRSDTRQHDVGSTINSRGDLTLVAGGELSARAAQVVSEKGAVAALAKDIRIESGEARYALDEVHQTKSKGFLSSKTKTTRDTLETTTALESTFSGDKVALVAERDITLKGSSVVASQDVALIAGRDLKLEAATETHKETHFKQTKRSGLSGSLTTGVNYGKSSAMEDGASTQTRAVGSQVSGGNVLLTATRDATLTGATVIADKDLDLSAGRNVDILAAQNTESETYRAKSSASSMMLMSGLAPRQTFYGSNSSQQSRDGRSTSATASLLSANTGNLTVTAGTDTTTKGTGTGNVTTQGADLLAGKDIRIEGNAVSLLASEATSQLDTHSKSKSFTLGAALAGTVGGQITRAYDMAKAAHDGTGNNRLDGALALKAGYDAYKAIDGAGKAMAAAADGAAASAEGAKGNGSAFGVSVSIGSSKSKSESHEASRSERGTSLQAENIVVKARESDLTAVGAKIEAVRDVTLEAARDVKLLAATNTARLESNNKSSNVGLGVTVGFGQQNGISFQIAASQVKGKTSGSETTYDNTRVTAGETLSVKSGGDTTLKGAQAGGKRIEADIGGKLVIETLQDRSDYKSKQTSSGFSLSLCIPPICYGMSSGSISASQQKISHSYQSAVGQSGLAAGSGGFDIEVKGETRLKGAAITSEAPEDKNRLATQSLSYEDLTNRQKTKGSSQSLALAGSYNFGADAGGSMPGGANTTARDPMQGVFTAPGTSPAGQAATNLLSNLGGNAVLPKNQNETSQTLSVISPARITITGTGNAETDEQSRQAAATLSGRDPKTANQALTNTLKLQDTARLEQQIKDARDTAQAATLVGQVAAGLIGDLSTAMRKPIDDAKLRQELDARQKEAERGGRPLTNVERYELARLDNDGMSSLQAEQTLKNPTAIANYQNWQEGSTNKVILHGLAGVLTAMVGKGNAVVGATAGALNEAVLPEMSKFLEAKGIKDGSEEYKGYMQLGSAMLGAGIGAVAGGGSTQGASLGGTVAHNATTFNYLDHPENRQREEARQKLKSCADDACRQQAQTEIDRLDALDASRNAAFHAACNGALSTSAGCADVTRDLYAKLGTFAAPEAREAALADKVGAITLAHKEELQSYLDLIKTANAEVRTSTEREVRDPSDYNSDAYGVIDRNELRNTYLVMKFGNDALTIANTREGETYFFIPDADGTRLAFRNGQSNKENYAPGLALTHADAAAETKADEAEKPYQPIDRFTISYAPTNGGVMDTAGTLVSKLGIDTAPILALREQMQAVTDSGQIVHWVAHSRGGEDLAQAASGQSNLSGNLVVFHAGANTRFMTEPILSAAKINLYNNGYRDSPYDLVPQIVGLRALTDPLNFVKSLVAAPCIFFCSAANSPHTLPYNWNNLLRTEAP